MAYLIITILGRRVYNVLFEKRYPFIHNYEIKKGLSLVLTHPKEVTFLMIEKCLSKCIMCGESYYDGNPERRITLEAYKKMLSHLQMDKVLCVAYAGGEPLLNPDIREIILYTSENFPQVKQKVLTNGMLLNKDMADFLIHHLGVINISLHATRPETHQRITQTDLFDRVRENIKYLAGRKIETGSPCRILLYMAISRINIKEVPGMVEFASKSRCDGVITWYCRFYPEARRFKKYDEIKNRLNESESLYFHQKVSDEYVSLARNLAQKLSLSFYHEPLFNGPFKPEPCSLPWFSIFIGPGGEVYPCCGNEMLFEKKILKGYYPSGNLVTQRIEDIWNNEFYQKIRKSCRSEKKKEIPECGYCGYGIRWDGPTVKKAHIMEWPES